MSKKQRILKQKRTTNRLKSENKRLKTILLNGKRKAKGINNAILPT